MNIRRTLFRLVVLTSVSAFLALGWVTTALAQVEGDGDGLDGDEFVLPILLVGAVVAFLGWMAIRGRSRRAS
jgi:hypothetical protein